VPKPRQSKIGEANATDPLTAEPSCKDMRLRDCHNFNDFRRLARRRLPGPIFDYIDGGADDEVTLRQNTGKL